MLKSEWIKYELDHVEDSPSQLAKVKFHDIELKTLGQILTPTQVQDVPKVEWTAEVGKLYSVFMVDPDAPSRAEPKYREWYHWGVINVPGTNLNEGEVVATYIGAGPPQGTGLHRYVILIYEQNERIQFTEDHLGFSMKDRPSTKVQQTAKKHNLRLLAGACFQAEYDDYVPVLYSKFPDT